MGLVYLPTFTYIYHKKQTKMYVYIYIFMHHTWILWVLVSGRVRGGPLPVVRGVFVQRPRATHKI